jgi:FecR protein
MTDDHNAEPPCSMHRRQFLTATAGLGAVLLVPCTAVAADIRELQGAVRVNGKAATKGTRVRPGDTIETGPGGKVTFVVGQDAFLLREQSRLTLEKSRGGKDVVIAGLRLLTGALLAAFGKGSRSIDTPTATAGIRGTVVYVEADADQTYFCTCYGEGELRDKARKERKFVISGYHTPNMIYARMVEGRMMAPSEVKNHTDDEIIMLEQLAGRTSPLVKRNQKLKEAGQAPRQPEAPRQPQAPAEPPAQAAPEAPKPQAPAAQSPAQRQPAAPPATAPEAPPAPPPAAPAQQPPSDLEWRLPPPRLN